LIFVAPIALSPILQRKNGAPGGTRTPDPLLRRQTLFPTELRAHGLQLIQFMLFNVVFAIGSLTISF
jgi:hypothetical protein